VTATIVQFVPSTSAAFTFSPSITGPTGVKTQYNAAVKYNLFGQRFYLAMTDLSNNPVCNVPVVGTGPTLPASFDWDQQAGQADVTTLTDHSVPIGSVAAARVSGTGASFDGEVQLLSTGPAAFTYGLLVDPVISTPVSGAVNFDLNLLQGLGIGWLTYNESTLQFLFE
jgi:hypothetical protein